MEESKQFEHGDVKPNVIEEPFPAYGVLDLDELKRYTYADYLTWLDNRRRELINGFIYLMSAPNLLHARITDLMWWFMELFVRKKSGNCRIFHAPFDDRLPIQNESADDQIFNVVQPDVCVICDLSKLDERGCIGAPDLIVEVLSPSTLKKDWNYKFNLYEKAGVREYWIVDPIAKAVNAFILQSDGNYDQGTIYTRKQSAPVHIFEGLEIDLQELFEE
ncbi:MAG: Uma2 family endonuclease [Prevotellaceae bacterium]|jgi:Uma2 family endonuclease|nr:Uma2 family endonuclease [Prevotellaceae bacterium]